MNLADVELQEHPTCDVCPGTGRTPDQREYPLPATLRCRLDGTYACSSGHAATHAYRHRWPKWEKVLGPAACKATPLFSSAVTSGPTTPANRTPPMGESK